MADQDRLDERPSSSGLPQNELDQLDRSEDPLAGDAPVLIAHGAMWAGPIPPPELLAEYDQVIPNGAERILSMAEKQSDHRMRMEAAEVSVMYFRWNAQS